MRKAIIILLLSLSVSAGLSAVSFEPYVLLGAGVSGCKVEDDMMRTAVRIDADLAVISLRFGTRHSIAFPLAFDFFFETPWRNGLQLDGHVDIGIGAAYRYALSDALEVEASAKVACKYYHRTDGLLFGMELGTALWYAPAGWFALGIPLKIGFTKGEVDISTGVFAVLMYSKR